MRHLAVLSIALTCLVTGATADGHGTICGLSVQSSVSVLTSRRIAGETVFDGYRVTADGALSRARWTGGNLLRGLSDVTDMGQASFTAARRALAQVTRASRDQAADGTTGSPPVRTYELSISQEGSPAQFVFRDRPAPALTDLMADWDAAAPLMTPATGDFIWSMPLPQDPGTPDVTLEAGPCADAGAARVAASLAAPHIVAAQSMTQTLNFDRTGRQRFIADLPEGFAYFGVLSSQ